MNINKNKIIIYATSFIQYFSMQNMRHIVHTKREPSLPNLNFPIFCLKGARIFLTIILEYLPKLLHGFNFIRLPTA